MIPQPIFGRSADKTAGTSSNLSWRYIPENFAPSDLRTFAEHYRDMKSGVSVGDASLYVTIPDVENRVSAGTGQAVE
jgi:hypothetical protein